MAATEARNYGNKARGVERRRLQNEETEEEKILYLNTKVNLQKYYKNNEAYNEAERLLTAKPEQDSKQVDIHIRWQKMGNMES